MDNNNNNSSAGPVASVEAESSVERCPFLTVQKVLSGKWSILVLCYLKNGPLRFGDLQRYMPEVTQTTLTKTLRKLENDRMINRTIFPVIPPHVEYSLTDIGMEIIPVLDAFSEFSIKYLEYFGFGDNICEEIKTGSCRCCKGSHQ